MSPEELKRRIALNVRKYREAAGMTQQELGEAIGVESRAYVSNIESCRQGLSLERLAQISEALDVEPKDLVK